MRTGETGNTAADDGDLHGYPSLRRARQSPTEGELQARGQVREQAQHGDERCGKGDVQRAAFQAPGDLSCSLVRRPAHGHGKVVATGQRCIDEPRADQRDVDAFAGQVQTQRFEQVAQRGFEARRLRRAAAAAGHRAADADQMRSHPCRSRGSAASMQWPADNRLVCTTRCSRAASKCRASMYSQLPALRITLSSAPQCDSIAARWHVPVRCR